MPGVDGRSARPMGIVTSLAAAYLLVRVGGFYLGTSVRRHHLESAAFLFTACVLIAVVANRRTATGTSPFARNLPRWIWLAFPCVAVALFAPAVPLGLFADDFVLLDAARQGRWTVWSDLFRPVLFPLWRAADALPGSTPVVLHLLNILLHGLNSAIVVVLSTRLGLATSSAFVAGSLFAAFPAAVEAVVWPAGVQDVLMTTFVVGFVMALTSRRGRAIDSAIALVLVVAAALTKETGFVAPVAGLLACGALPEGRRPWKVAFAAVGVVVVLLALRFAFVASPEQGLWSFSRYELKELLVRPFATLIVPLRASEIVAIPSVPIFLVAVVVISLSVAAFRWTAADARFRRVLFGVGLVLAAAAPVGVAFFVGPDLFGSRYLYLPAAGWAIALATLLPLPARGQRLVRALPAALLVVCWIAATRAHLRPWAEAAAVRDAILGAAETQAPAGCREVTVSGLPEALEGVPVFVNGFPEAMRERDDRVRFSVGVSGGDCALTWDGAAFR